MKKVYFAVGLVLLLALSVSVSAAAKAPAAKQTVLVLDGNPILFADGYGEGNIYAEGWTGGTEPILGKFHDAYVLTEAVGGYMSQSVWRIENSGDIWIVYFFEGGQTSTAQGAIIGGTGIYVGASGQVFQEVVSEDPFIVRATFVFEKAIKP